MLKCRLVLRKSFLQECNHKCEKLRASGCHTKVPREFNFATDVIDKFADDPDIGNRTAFQHVDATEQCLTRFTYKEFSDETKRCGSALRSLGVIKRSLVILPHVPEWWLINIAALRNDTVLFPTSKRLDVIGLESRLLKSKADGVVADFQEAIKVEQISEDYKLSLKHKILVVSHQEMAENKEAIDELVNSQGWILLKELMDLNGTLECPLLKKTPLDQTMQVFFSSGTTGNPKIIAHSHGFAYGLVSTGRHWMNLTPDDLHWNLSDNGFALQAYSGLFGPMSQGAGVFAHGMSSYNPAKVLETLKSNPITSFCAVPNLYRKLVIYNHSIPQGSSLKQCLSAGEPLAGKVAQKWKELSGLDVREGYGISESTIISGTFKGMEIKPGSMGKPCPGYNVEIVDNMGNQCPVGKQGNIAIDCNPKPAGFFKKYLNSNMENKMVGNYFVTGDRGYMDEDGYLWFDSRTDDLIISAGYRIGPFEVESALLSHPDVIEAAAVSSPDPRRGVVVKAFVVLNEKKAKKLAAAKHKTTELIESLQDLCKQINGPYKFPRKVEFVKSLPKSMGGKVLRYKLREWERNSCKRANAIINPV